jgi:hypothetical protein
MDKKSNIKRKFTKLKNRWEKETTHCSSTSDIIKHPAYQKIINMGTDVLPFRFEDLKHNYNHWFVALMIITGENPVLFEHSGNIIEMTEDWLKWGRIHKYLIQK